MQLALLGEIGTWGEETAVIIWARGEAGEQGQGQREGVREWVRRTQGTDLTWISGIGMVGMPGVGEGKSRGSLGINGQ